MIYTLGVDIGSTTSKCVLLKDGSEMVATSLISTGTGTKGPAAAYKEVLETSGVSADDISYTVATGYGRNNFTLANLVMSELSCHGKGVHFLYPEVSTIIDIGGQDAKVIRLNKSGTIENFVMNDKCAAGTGRFLEVMARILELDIGELEEKYKEAKNPVKISSTCTVFAESEVISQLSGGADICNVVAGICRSVASRVSSLAKRLGVVEKVCMTGGVARNGGVRDSLEKELRTKIIYSEHAQLMGAFGAALIAYDNVK